VARAGYELLFDTADTIGGMVEKFVPGNAREGRPEQMLTILGGVPRRIPAGAC